MLWFKIFRIFLFLCWLTLAGYAGFLLAMNDYVRTVVCMFGCIAFILISHLAAHSQKQIDEF